MINSVSLTGILALLYTLEEWNSHCGFLDTFLMLSVIIFIAVPSLKDSSFVWNKDGPRHKAEWWIGSNGAMGRILGERLGAGFWTGICMLIIE